jgi:hypothetical protein
MWAPKTTSFFEGENGMSATVACQRVTGGESHTLFVKVPQSLAKSSKVRKTEEEGKNDKARQSEKETAAINRRMPTRINGATEKESLATAAANA